MKNSQDCPCHSGKTYAKCCRPYHRGQLPPNVLALMRSRYSAYSLSRVGYIVKTMHPDSPLYREDEVAWRKQLQWFCDNTNFAGLQIVNEATMSPNKATVTFSAILLQQGKDASFTECSLFEKVKGRWLYVNALDMGKK